MIFIKWENIKQFALILNEDLRFVPVSRFLILILRNKFIYLNPQVLGGVQPQTLIFIRVNEFTLPIRKETLSGQGGIMLVQSALIHRAGEALCGVRFFRIQRNAVV